MKPRVLIADDDPDVLEVLGAVLSPDYEVTIAHDGKEVLSLFKKRRTYDAIVLDIWMPRVDGPTVMQRLRERGIHVPTILASADPAVASAAERLGAAGYVEKPFSVRELRTKLAGVMGNGAPRPSHPP